MNPYVVKQGDYLTQLAHDLGFDKDAVWNDDKNADLRASRPNPEMLYPGDVVYLPDQSPTPSPMAQGTENGYAADVPTVKVTVTFSNEDPAQSLANEAYEVDGLPVTSGTTDGNGEASFDVPVIVRDFTVTFTAKEYAFHILVGSVDPPTEESGLRFRLANLGFYRRVADDEDADALAGAISDFQKANSITVTGAIDDATRDAIVAAHDS